MNAMIVATPEQIKYLEEAAECLTRYLEISTNDALTTLVKKVRHQLKELVREEHMSNTNENKINTK